MGEAWEDVGIGIEGELLSRVGEEAVVIADDDEIVLLDQGQGPFQGSDEDLMDDFRPLLDEVFQVCGDQRPDGFGEKDDLLVILEGNGRGLVESVACGIADIFLERLDLLDLARDVVVQEKSLEAAGLENLRGEIEQGAIGAITSSGEDDTKFFCHDAFLPSSKRQYI